MPIRKNPPFIMRKVDDVGIKQRKDDGYFDVASMCDVSDKDLTDYLELRKTERFLQLLSEELGIDKSELIQPKNKFGEIWVHPYVAINFAQWATADLALSTIKCVFEWVQDKTREALPVEDTFEDVDPEFTEWIRKAASFDPRKSKKTSK